MLTKETNEGKEIKETVKFQVTFDPTDLGVTIQLPNGKTVTSQKKEVMKHATRAVIKVLTENNMNKKAASLRPFMKDEVPTSPKKEKLRQAFLDIPVAKRAKKEKGDNVHRLTKGHDGLKKGNWSNEEDVAILDHAAKYEGKDVDWSMFSLPGRVSSQWENRYKVLSRKRKKGDWTKEEDDAILKYGQEIKDNDWSAFTLPGRVPKQCSHRYRKLTIGKVNWTKEEDDAILKHGEEIGDTNWSVLSLPNRTLKQCSKRHNYLTSKKSESPIKKGGWTKEEDQQIMEHGTNLGDKDWNLLAETLPGRVAKQCSNRYQRLSNKDQRSSKQLEVKKKGGWTAEEDEKILTHVTNVGQKDWWILAKDLPGRFPNQCKNRYWRLSKVSDGSEEKKSKAWTVDEDQFIKDHVEKYGPEKWKLAADQLGRAPGGCKKRWFKYLSKTGVVSEDFELV